MPSAAAVVDNKPAHWDPICGESTVAKNVEALRSPLFSRHYDDRVLRSLTGKQAAQAVISKIELRVRDSLKDNYCAKSQEQKLAILQTDFSSKNKKSPFDLAQDSCFQSCSDLAAELTAVAGNVNACKNACAAMKDGMEMYRLGALRFQKCAPEQSNTATPTVTPKRERSGAR